MSKRRPRPDDGLRIAGRNPVLEALAHKAASLEKVYLQKGLTGSVIDEIAGKARAAGVPFQFVPPQKLRALAGDVNHQGVVAEATAVTYRDVDDMLSEIGPSLGHVQRTKPLLLVLDRIQDPHNFGAILRSAVAAGVSGVIVPDRDMAPVNTATMKTSAGMAQHIPIARVRRLPDVMHQLKERGYWVIGAESTAEQTMWNVDWDRPTAIVMGGEERGMRKAVADACDLHVRIPISGLAESLNASVAAGVLLFVAQGFRAFEEE
ncbi:MAG: 23S rRNA (guanosine(2251)-2'-O)-methyltransferase RlmB [Bacteroidota bacterium]